MSVLVGFAPTPEGRAAVHQAVGECRLRGGALTILVSQPRPTGIAAGCCGPTGRAIVAAEMGRPTGRGAGTPGRAYWACGWAAWRWGMVMSVVSGLARVGCRLPHRLRDTHVLIQRVGGPA